MYLQQFVPHFKQTNQFQMKELPHSPPLNLTITVCDSVYLYQKNTDQRGFLDVHNLQRPTTCCLPQKWSDPNVEWGEFLRYNTNKKSISS